MPATNHDTRVSRPPIPREHGAWGILGGAFLLVVALTGAITTGMGLLLFAMAGFYFSRHALLAAVRRQPRTNGLFWCALFALIGLLLLLAAARAANYWRIFFWCMLLVPFLIAELLLISSHKQQSLLAQLIGTAGLTATAPLAYLVYIPGWTRDAAISWPIAILFFAGLVIFVRFQIESMSAAAARTLSRKRYRHALFIYNAIVLLALALLALNGGAYRWSIAVFIPSIVQAFAAGITAAPVKTIRRLGWLQMAHTVLFVVLAALFLRG